MKLDGVKLVVNANRAIKGLISAEACEIILEVISGNTRLVEIARSIGMSKQSVGQLTKSLIDKGFLSIVPSSHDGRAKVLSITTDGMSVIQVINGRILFMDKR